MDTNHAVPTIRAHLAPAQPMATPKPANSQLLRITDPTSGAEMHIEGLSEAAARYVAWRTWYAAVADDVANGYGRDEIARLIVEPISAAETPRHSTRERVWSGPRPVGTRGDRGR